MDSPTNIAEVAGVLELVKSALTSLGILVGAFWTYFHFIKGRLYYPKLELTVDLDIAEREESYLLLAKTTMRNLGLSRVNFDLTVSALELSEVKEMRVDDGALTAVEDEIGVFDVLEAHRWVEAAEVVWDQCLVVVRRRGQVAFAANARVVGQRGLLRRKRYEWNARGTAFTAIPPTEDVDISS